jgi:hypothetical protein
MQRTLAETSYCCCSTSQGHGHFPVPSPPACLFLLLFTAAIPLRADDADRPNVLLIVSEDNGAELGCYGTPDVRTPHLDQLAAAGCRFTNAYVTQAVCSASRAELAVSQLSPRWTRT